MLVGTDTAHSLHSVVLSNPLKMFTQTGSQQETHRQSLGQAPASLGLRRPNHPKSRLKGWKDVSSTVTTDSIFIGGCERLKLRWLLAQRPKILCSPVQQ